MILRSKLRVKFQKKDNNIYHIAAMLRYSGFLLRKRSSIFPTVLTERKRKSHSPFQKGGGITKVFCAILTYI